jgi:hypothetical protein
MKTVIASETIAELLSEELTGLVAEAEVGVTVVETLGLVVGAFRA